MGEERADRRWGLVFLVFPNLLATTVLDSRVLSRLPKERKKKSLRNKGAKGVYESVLDDDHHEWLTLSSKTRPRFPRAHLQLLILHPVQRAVTRRPSPLGNSCSAAVRFNNNAARRRRTPSTIRMDLRAFVSSTEKDWREVWAWGSGIQVQLFCTFHPTKLKAAI